MADCNSCGAAVVWAVTKNEKRMPLDALPTSDGTWVVVSGETWKATPQDRALLRPLYTPHWATCIHAAEHRKPRT
jgi:hypothetical protein